MATAKKSPAQLQREIDEALAKSHATSTSHATKNDGSGTAYWLLYWPFERNPKTAMPREHWGPFSTEADAEKRLSEELNLRRRQGYAANKRQYRIRRLTRDQYHALYPWGRSGNLMT